MTAGLNHVHLEVIADIGHAGGQCWWDGRVPLSGDHQAGQVELGGSDLRQSFGVSVDIAIPVDAAAEAGLLVCVGVVVQVGRGQQLFADRPDRIDSQEGVEVDTIALGLGQRLIRRNAATHQLLEDDSRSPFEKVLRNTRLLKP